jgi:hypothetical protein
MPYTHPRETDSSEVGRAHVHACRPGRTTQVRALWWVCVPPLQTAPMRLAFLFFAVLPSVATVGMDVGLLEGI